MENTPLIIPPNKRVKGLVVYCYKCKTNITSGICKTTGKPIKQCPHGDKHVFKVYVSVPGTSNERRTKKLETRDVNEAIKQALDFEKEIKENKNQNNIEKEVRIINRERTIKQTTKQEMPNNLLNAMARYVGFLYNDKEIVPEFRKEIRSKKHVGDIERNFKYFVICLKQNGYNPDKLSLSEVNDQVIGKFHDYILKELNLSNSSYNRAMKELTSFYNFFINEGYQIRNPFKSIPRKQENANVETITEEEYSRLLEIIQKPELGKSTLSNGVVKNMYKPWMKEAVELGLFTGRRTEEIVQMKWNNVFDDEKGNLLFIKVIDYKVSRQKGQEFDNPKYIYIPITEELSNLLFRIGYEKYKGNDKYILAPEETVTRDTVNHFITHSFPHYYKQLETGRNLSYKCLRKTYISKLSAYMGIDNARLITKHSGTQVMENNYIDKKIIAETAHNFKMFKQENNRQNEIEKIRDINNEKTLER